MARTMAGSIPFGAVKGMGRQGEVVPMSEMNTTPLIDVMLVLLIMFIITIPSQTDQVEIALPKVGTTITINPLKNELRLSASGQLSWNNREVSDGELASALASIATNPKPPEVHFRPDAAARYERVDQVLAIAARSGASTFGFAGNEQYKKVF